MRKSIPKSYQYIEKLAPPETRQMNEARAYSQKLGLDTISISTTEAQIIKFHLLSIQAKKVLEIGTLTGLSALHILQALPKNAKLTTLEKSKEHAELAKEVLQDEIKNERCEILLGDAKETLAQLDRQMFDAIFIDGNKSAYLDYFKWSLEHIRAGGLIFVDNVFLAGAVWGDSTTQKFNQKQIGAVSELNRQAFENPGLRSVIIPTEEGLLICQKCENK